MRFLRLLFIVLLAIVLVAVALANREMVTLNAFPVNLDAYLGGKWSVELPLFMVIFLAVAFGMLAGLIWEYLREAHVRREARNRSAEVARLEREVGSLRERHANPRDEVLAIIDRPKGTGTDRPVTTANPASGTTLPAAR
ncbi:LapA family protein [Paracoccus alkanivorans]|uniref:LapA family protein n=1 Tax=Paracoccus alkanivorans TaxID=2116655 RepID=A0A3M0MIP2_9RHOB|nr:LapA family protein [Paracoccus alkanivorans]RMC37622.1 LapA family protein [Paracoccus alkanivorans]